MPRNIHIDDLFDVSVDTKNLVDVGDENDNVQHFAFPFVSTPKAGNRKVNKQMHQSSTAGSPQTLEESWSTILATTPVSVGKSGGLGLNKSNLGFKAGGLSRRQSSAKDWFEPFALEPGGT
jgi:hypothetical protein